MADRNLTVRFIGNTSDLAGNIDGVSGKFGVFAKGVAAVGAVVATGVVAAGKALLDIGTTFDDVSDTIRTATGATGAQLDGLVDSAKKVGTSVPSSFEEVGTTIAGLNQRLGQTGPELETLAVQMLDLSRITGTDLNANIEGITRVFGDWSISTEDQLVAMDSLFTASQATGVGIDKLSENVVKFGGPLRQLGFSFEESIAMIGKFEKEGVNTELVMGSMRIALGKMAKAGKDPIATFREMTDKIKNAGDAGTANKLALELFGAKAGPDMAAAIREGRFEIDELVKTIENGGGSISSAAEDTADFAENWMIFKNKVMVALEPVATRVFGMINEKMTQLGEWFDRNQSTVQGFVTGVAAGFGLLLDATGTIVGVLTGVGMKTAEVVMWLNDHLIPVLAILGPILIPLAFHFAAVGVAALAASIKTGIAWAVTSAGAVAAGITHGIVVMGMVAGWILTGTQSLIRGAQVAAGWVLAMGPVGWVIALVVGLVALIIANWDTIVRWTTQAWNAVSGAVWGAWDWINRRVSDGVNWVRGVLSWFGGLGGMFDGWWSNAVNAVTNAIYVMMRWIGDIPGRILGALGNLGAMLWNSGSALVSGFWDGIVARWNQLVSWFRNAMAGLRSMFPFSPAREGPFSGRGYVTYSGRALTGDFAASIRAGMPEVLASVRGVLGAAQVGFSASVTPLAPVGSGGSGAAVAAARDTALKLVGNADQAVATMIMELIRSGKLQLG